MSGETILVTGGAGFIGSFLVDALVERGYQVRILDNLDPQVHGDSGRSPDYLNSDAEFVYGDVRDRDTFRKALSGVAVVFHMAAAVGVGQSMYEVRKYVETNTLGVANLLDIIARGEAPTITKMIIPSSMSIYGEGAYRCEGCGVVYPLERTRGMLERRQWNPVCPHCGGDVAHDPVSETKPLNPSSVYAVTKRDHEELSMIVGRAYGVSTFALRYFNAYGPRQALTNPYTGVAAIFCGNLLRGKPPIIFEDGRQMRDFVHISDILSASLACMDAENVQYGIYNVGSANSISINELAVMIAHKMGVASESIITNKYRVGDIRHCYADVSLIEKEIGWTPKIRLEDGISDLISWVTIQTPREAIGDAMKELVEKGLTK